MKSRRFSLLTAILLVAVLAVDFAWLRSNIIWFRSLVGLDAPAFDTGVAVMATIIFVVECLSKPGRFRNGFWVGGLLAILAFAWIARYRGDWVRAYANPLVWGTAAVLKMDRHGPPIIYSMDLVIFAVPQVALASACGLLAKLILPAPTSD